MTSDSGEINSTETGSARLVLMMGERQREYDLSKGKLTVGRTTENDIALTFDKVASREHAIFGEADGLYFVKDLNSSNGTLLNGKRVEADKRVELSNGDIVTVGDTDIRFEFAGAGEDYSGTMLIDQSEARKALASMQPYDDTAYDQAADEPQWITYGFWGAIALIVGLIIYAVMQL